jgi:hypothetical protein
VGMVIFFSPRTRWTATSCATAVAVSACRAFIRRKEIAPGNRAVKLA